MIAAVVLVLIRTLTLALSFQRRRTNKIIGRERNLVNGGLEGWKGGGGSPWQENALHVLLFLFLLSFFLLFLLLLLSLGLCLFVFVSLSLSLSLVVLAILSSDKCPSARKGATSLFLVYVTG